MTTKAGRSKSLSRTAGEGGAPGRAGGGGGGSALRDDALLPQRRDFLRRVAGERLQHLLAVLPEQRRPLWRDRRVRQPQRADDRREPAARRMVEIDDRAAPAQMRI